MSFGGWAGVFGLGVGLLSVGCKSAQPHADLPRPDAAAFYANWTPPRSPDPAPPSLAPRPPAYVPPAPVGPVQPRPEINLNPPAPTPLPQPPLPTPHGKDYDSAWLPNSGAEARRRSEMGNWKYVVIHHSDSDRGGLAAIKAYHVGVRGWKDVGYDFVIGNGSLTDNGEIEVSGRWKAQDDGAHAGVEKYNKQGIGICLVGNLQDHGATPQQMAALGKLVRFLCDRYHIPRDRDHIIGHGDFRSTQCPGAKFNWADLMRRI